MVGHGGTVGDYPNTPTTRKRTLVLICHTLAEAPKASPVITSISALSPFSAV
jgi:hypothetical protein